MPHLLITVVPAVLAQVAEEEPSDGVAIGIGLAVLTAWVVSAVVTALKGKWGFFALGFLIGLFWLIGALRLAKPGSWWARRFYDERKMDEARRRHG